MPEKTLMRSPDCSCSSRKTGAMMNYERAFSDFCDKAKRTDLASVSHSQALSARGGMSANNLSRKTCSTPKFSFKSSVDLFHK
jgi:hypothetical protein